MSHTEVEWISLEEFARRIGVPESWPYEYTRARAEDPLPHVKFGKYPRVQWGSPALEAWMMRRFKGSKQEVKNESNREEDDVA
jgi:hypothetical protein